MSSEDFSKGSSSGTMEPCTSRTSPGAASTSPTPEPAWWRAPLLGRRQLFVDLSSEVTPLADGLLDGITVDGDGNLYVAVHGDGRIFVISPEGEVLRDRGRVPWGQGITS